MSGWRRRVSSALARTAADRLRRRRPEWAEALLGEQHSLGPTDENLRWALGSLWASLTLDGAVHAALLIAAVAALAAYQWSADESLVTVAFTATLALLLGLVRPSRSFVSALAVGSVVAAVNAFETASGVRPAYELHLSSWAHDAEWLCFVAPALAGAAVGRTLGRPAF